MRAQLLFAYCFLFQSNFCRAARLALATLPAGSLPLAPTPISRWTVLMATAENPHKHLWGQAAFPVILLFVFPPPSQTLYLLLPPAIAQSVSHLMALPFLSLGGSVCIWAMIFVISRWNPCCDSRVCIFAYQHFQAAAGDHTAFSVAVSTWLAATWLSHKVQARFKRVLWCTYNSGDAGCSEWIAVHIKYSEAESNVRELGHSTKTPNIDFSYKP